MSEKEPARPGGPVSLAEQLAAVRAESARLDARNRFGGAYASLASVLDAAHKALAGTGLAFVQLIDSDPVLAEDGTAGMVQLTVVTRLFNSAGESLESRMSIVCDSNPQIIGAYITYFRRYQIAAMLSIAAEEDDDGEGAMAGQAAQKPMSGGKPQPAAGGRKPPAPAAGGKSQAPAAANQDAITAYWSAVNERGMTRGEGMAKLQAAGGDFQQALFALQNGSAREE